MSANIKVYVGDITESDCDVIVNAANSWLKRGGGVCGAIWDAAGDQIADEIDQSVLPLNHGEVFVTSGGDLKAKYIFHAVGPIWHGGNDGEDEALANCYYNACAKARGIAKSICFPCISTGIYGYPKDLAADIAVLCLLTMDHVARSIGYPLDIQVCCFSDDDLALYVAAIEKWKPHIGKNREESQSGYSNARTSTSPYGCYNRNPLEQTVRHSQDPNVTWPFMMSMYCQYDRSQDDPRCKGCIHGK
jgi:O-acetyl-ADP-ribose deacetylase (regulator of RNase III)